jgi:hypothetical protein
LIALTVVVATGAMSAWAARNDNERPRAILGQTPPS